MFKFIPDTGVPGFRVGLPDDEDGSVPSTAPVVPGATTFGYDPDASALPTTAPMAFNPFGASYDADSGLYPPPDRVANLYAGSGANLLGFGNPQGPPTGMISGGTHLSQFAHVSNFNVGLFCQQAGLTLDETLRIAGTYACWRSNNSDQCMPHCLNTKQFEYITAGYKAAQSGMFGQSD